MTPFKARSRHFCTHTLRGRCDTKYCAKVPGSAKGQTRSSFPTAYTTGTSTSIGLMVLFSAKDRSPIT